MICKKCRKDHLVKNEGKLNVCELEEYFRSGCVTVAEGKKYRAFGTGNRYQHEGAK